MATQTKPATRGIQQTQPDASKGQVAILPPRLLMPLDFGKEYDLTEGKWRAIIDSLYPSAKTLEGVGMALAYCKARNLDIFKRPVHIVPIYSAALRRTTETVWPGINELRSTAMRTKNYAGLDTPLYGPMIKHTFAGGKTEKWDNGQHFWNEDKGITLEFPEWCQITVYRLLQNNRVPFPGPRVYWLETYAKKGRATDNPNDMWEKRSNGQLEKCAEAAALRRAFPEEIGDDYVPEEIGAFHTHHAVDITGEGSATTAPPEPRREDFKEPAASPVQPGAGQADTTPLSAGGGHSTPEAAATPEHDPQTGEVKEPPTDKSQLTDVEDLNAPPLFEDYGTKIGRFFDFADTWLQDPIRMEAEVVAFGAFYNEYIRDRMKPDYKHYESMVDTKRLYDEALKRASAKR